MSPLETQMAEVLVSAKEKLEIYYKQTKGVYAGGMNHGSLQIRIIDALNEYNRQVKQQQNTQTY